MVLPCQVITLTQLVNIIVFCTEPFSYLAKLIESYQNFLPYFLSFLYCSIALFCLYKFQVITVTVLFRATHKLGIKQPSLATACRLLDLPERSQCNWYLYNKNKKMVGMQNIRKFVFILGDIICSQLFQIKITLINLA